MSFNKDTRNLLAKTVTACRRRLTEDVTDQLRGVFGLHPDGTVLALKEMTHLSPDQTAAAGRLRDLLDHYTAGAAGGEKDRRKSAYERMTLEISFTILNRLAALRLCEERGLVVECVLRGTASDGFRLFERVSGGALGGRYDTYRVFLECLFDELALDLGMLFDRMTPQSAVFPTERCLEDVLAELNKNELTHLWTEDETIGWVYQYFNPPEERKAMRDASQAPRNSRELAVRNQFFTPRYVVEFLTDNTLGRIWYEMRKGETALREECRYLVRRPNEIFLLQGQEGPAAEENEDDLSQEELLKKPVHIEHRPKKDPRDLRVLDPACGSGHFLLYAFDLLERIYEEAWEDTESPKPEYTDRTLREDFENLDDLRQAVPKLVIEHNLHGVDIDPRAVQIAALALWLRAQKTWKNLNIKAAERPQVTKSNIVTAEPMPGEEDMKEEFTAGLKPCVLGQLVDVVFDKMKLAGEAGSLLKIEEEIKDAVAEAKEEYRKELRLRKEEASYLPGMAPERAPSLFDFTDMSDQDFLDQAEDGILAALKDYAERAENGRAVRRHLFAEDAARGFAFIDLCRRRYDVVLMNPPFGDATKKGLAYLLTHYPISKKNLYIAFIKRASEVCVPLGKVGSITDRTFVTHTRHEDFRNHLIYGESDGWRIQSIVDHGWGVLDSYVQTASSVLCQSSQDHRIACFDLKAATDPASSLLDGTQLLSSGIEKDRVYLQDLGSLQHLPKGVLAFWMPTEIIDAFKNYDSLDPTLIEARSGLSSSDNERFYKLVWEVPRERIGKTERWSFLANGGDPSPFLRSQTYVIDYENDGMMVKQLARDLYTSETRTIKNQQYYRRFGLTYGKRTENFNVQMLPSDQLFSNEGHSLFSLDKGALLAACAYLNSTIASYILNCIAGLHKESGYVGSLPVPQGILENSAKFAREAASGYGIMAKGFSMIPESQCFISPLVATGIAVDEVEQSLNKIQHGLQSICDEIDNITARAFSLNRTSVDKIGRRQWYVGKILYDSVGIEQAHRVFLADTFGWIVGLIFGRWDVRIAMDPSLGPKLPDPFDPLPVCPPGMLVGPDGLPAGPGRIGSEEWLRARPDANTLPPEGAVKKSIIPDSDYPLRINWDGVLVDDPGFNGVQPPRDDIVRRIREVLDLLWKDKAYEIEQEACDILGVSELRDYFRKPAGFFQDHLKRYSKCRRKAPIYQPLSTASGSYTIWLYYHRLTDQTLYATVNKYVEPKITEVERGLARIEDELKTASGREATQLRDRLNETQTFLGELRDLREELLRIAELPYKPNLNDGVIISAAPLHNLFRLRAWANDTKKVWGKLEKGDYDWAHLAHTIWPDRVQEACKKDRSIAIAHGLEDICEVEAPAPKKKGGGRRKKEAAR